MEPHRESRKRLRPWLERMINSGDCPGVVWEKREERTFRIPWRHFNNKDWVERDSKIFLEWAKYTGKYKDGDPIEYPVWKTRLRCALKKIPEIKELPELHQLENDDPYRIYQFIDPPVVKKGNDFDSDGCASPASSASAFTNSPAYIRDFLEESSSPPPPNYGDHKCQAPSANVPTVIYDEEEKGVSPSTYNNLTIKEENLHAMHLYEQQANAKNNVQHPHIQEGNYMEVSDFPYGCYNIPPGGVDFLPQESSRTFVYPNMVSSATRTAGSDVVSSTTSDEPALAEPDSMKASLPSDLNSLDSNDLYHMSGLNTSEFNHMSTGSLPGSLRNQMMSSLSSRQSAVEHSMQLRLYYGFPKHYTLHQAVKGNGCRLYYGASAPTLQNTVIEEEMYGPKNVYQLEMPNAESVLDIPQEQRKFIRELLDSMERGLVLTLKDGDIYAQRLCRTRVFMTDGEKHSALLDRKDKSPTKIFDFNGNFKSAYEKCRGEANSEIPKPFTYLTFGQEIRKDRHNPMSRILIHVQVTHTEASRLVDELTSSTGSFQPLLSSLDSHDKLLDRFKRMQLTPNA